MYGVRCSVFDVWCLVYGVWCVVYGVWNGVRCSACRLGPWPGRQKKLVLHVGALKKVEVSEKCDGTLDSFTTVAADAMRLVRPVSYCAKRSPMVMGISPCLFVVQDVCCMLDASQRS